MWSDDVQSDRYKTEAILKLLKSLRKFYTTMNFEEILCV
jgi:hypothetical protein